MVPKGVDFGTKSVTVFATMQLATYLESKELSDAAFARLIGVERQAVGRYKAGERFPEKQILLEIYRVTGGQVSANDFAGIPTEEATDQGGVE